MPVNLYKVRIKKSETIIARLSSAPRQKWSTPTPTPTPTPMRHVLWTDIDCDGDADATDSLKELRHVAGLSVSQTRDCPENGSEVASLLGDANCDGNVDAMDALKKLRKVAGLSVAQEAECPEIGSTVEIPTA
jgi:hypothetical protein